MRTVAIKYDLAYLKKKKKKIQISKIIKMTSHDYA